MDVDDQIQDDNVVSTVEYAVGPTEVVPVMQSLFDRAANQQLMLLPPDVVPTIQQSPPVLLPPNPVAPTSG